MCTISASDAAEKAWKNSECTFAHGFDDVGGSTLVRQNDEADMWAKAADFAK